MRVCLCVRVSARVMGCVAECLGGVTRQVNLTDPISGRLPPYEAGHCR